MKRSRRAGDLSPSTVVTRRLGWRPEVMRLPAIFSKMGGRQPQYLHHSALKLTSMYLFWADMPWNLAAFMVDTSPLVLVTSLGRELSAGPK